MRLFRLSSVAATSAAFLISSTPATLLGQTVTAEWLNPVSGNWTDATNWSTNPVYPENGSPAPNVDVAVIVDGSPFVLTLADSVTLHDIIIDSSDATLSHTNGLLTAQDVSIEQGTYVLDGGQMLVRKIISPGGFAFSSGSLEMTDSALIISPTGIMGDAVTVGAGSMVKVDALAVGEDGYGELHIEEGGQVRSYNGRLGTTIDSAIVSVTGTGSTWTIEDDLKVGNYGSPTSTLDITDAATVEVANYTSIGEGGHGQGTIQVSGSGSNFRALGGITVTAASGFGLLEVSDHAVMDSDTIFVDTGNILRINAGTVRITDLTGPGSIEWTTGTVEYIQQGENAHNAYIQSGRPFSPLLTLNAGMTLIVAGTTFIGTGNEVHLNGGEFRTGTLDIDGTFAFTGGTLEITGEESPFNLKQTLGTTFTLGPQSTLIPRNGIKIDTGTTFNISGGTLSTSLLINKGVVNFESGEINVAEIRLQDGTIIAPSLDLASNTLSGYGHIGCDLHNPGGIIDPGTEDPFAFTRHISIDGDLFQGAQATLTIDLNHAYISNNDKVEIVGTAHLGGKLSIIEELFIAPTIGQSFVILTFYDRNGDFDSILGRDIGDGLFFDLVYSPNQLNLVVEQAGQGDSDFDGDVDLNDLSTLATYYGAASGALWSQGDYDGDGDVDLNDLSVLAANYGSGEAQAFADFATLASVPEPHAAALLLVAMVLKSRPKRR